MGTRFIATEESIASNNYKQMIIDSAYKDLILTNSFTGAHAYYLRPSVIAAGLDPDALDASKGMNLSGYDSKIKAWRDIWSAGQGVGTITAVQSVTDIVDQLVAEYEDAKILP